MSVVQAPVRYKERHGAIPRRKSCRACAKAKRRCDLFLPVCSRCNQRGLHCEYPLLVTAANLAEFTIHQPIVSFQQELPPPLPLPQSYGMYNRVGDSALSTRSLREARFSSGMARMRFTLDAFQNAHRTMVLDNQTPWCHPLLYQNGMPRSMQDAYSCCSLYMNRNATNSKSILAIIENRAADLLSSEQPSSPIECLARLQALIIYQTIRLFDDDTSARLAADLTMPALRSSLTYFLQNVCLDDMLLFLSGISINSLLEEPPSPLESSPAGGTGHNKDFWQIWIFEESARRTIFLAYLLIRVWEVMNIFSNTNEKEKQEQRKKLSCDGRLGLSHTWYMAAHLWEAPTRYEFALAYAEKNRFLIRDLNLTEFLELGRPDDVDMFGKMVLSASMGMEALRDWYLARGEILEV